MPCGGQESGGGGNLADLSEALLLDVFAGVPCLPLPRAALALPAAQLLADETGNQVFASRGEARKMMLGGGVSVNRQKLATPDQPVCCLFWASLLSYPLLLAGFAPKSP